MQQKFPYISCYPLKIQWSNLCSDNIFKMEVLGKAPVDPLPEACPAAKDISVPNTVYVPRISLDEWKQYTFSTRGSRSQWVIGGSLDFANYISSLLNKDELSDYDSVSWATYQPNQMEWMSLGCSHLRVSPTWVLPILMQKSTNPLVLFLYEAIKANIFNRKNPGQAPV